MMEKFHSLHKNLEWRRAILNKPYYHHRQNANCLHNSHLYGPVYAAWKTCTNQVVRNNYVLSRIKTPVNHITLYGSDRRKAWQNRIVCCCNASITNNISTLSCKAVEWHIDPGGVTMLHSFVTAIPDRTSCRSSSHSGILINAPSGTINNQSYAWEGTARIHWTLRIIPKSHRCTSISRSHQRPAENCHNYHFKTNLSWNLRRLVTK